MRSISKLIPILAATTVLVVFCSPLGALAEQKLTLSGSSTLAPLASEMAKSFEQQHRDVRIDVQTGGSTRGIVDAKNGLSDLGMSSRALYPAESTALTSYTVAIDGVAFVVHEDNRIDALSKQQARDIYSGKITNWGQLGAPDAPISVINRAKGRSEYDLVAAYLKLKPTEYHEDVVAGENQQCIKLISSNPNAIVYLSVGTAEYEVSRGAPIKILALEGIEGSVKTVQNGTFPIVRPLLFVSRERPAGLLKEFLDFALSRQVSELIREQSFVPPR